MTISRAIRTSVWQCVGTEVPSATTAEWDGPTRKEGER